MPYAHLTLATRDVQRTAEFFEATLRWRRIGMPDNSKTPGAWLSVGPMQQLHLVQVDDFHISPFEGEFSRHMAVFHPGSDFPALKQRLTAHGAELIAPERPTPFERFFFRDPNGYIIEVIAEEQYADEAQRQGI